MGGGGGVMSGRGAATALGKLTWGFAAAFIATSITLTIVAAKNASDSSVLDRLGAPAAEAPAQPEAPLPPTLPGGGDLLPPSASDTPALPPRAE